MFKRLPMLAAHTSLAVLVLTAASAATLAQHPQKVVPPKMKASAPVVAQYECQKCHMRYGAAQAKKNHFVDPMDGGKLTLVKTASKPPKKATSPSATKPKP